jgi:hypothetical protein
MSFTILPNGDLKITADNECRAFIADEMRKGHDYGSIWADITEWERCNGGFTPFDAGDANPFVGLTSAPCIAESMDYHDDGTLEIVGRFWYFADYQITSELEELRDKGRVVFTLAREG